MSDIEDESLKDEDPTTMKDNPFPTILCAVCQAFPVSRAILPCAHLCVCYFCFEKVSRCPICRGPIQLFFRTQSETYVANSGLTKSETSPLRKLTWPEYFEHISERIQAYLDFGNA